MLFTAKDLRALKNGTPDRQVPGAHMHYDRPWFCDSTDAHRLAGSLRALASGIVATRKRGAAAWLREHPFIDACAHVMDHDLCRGAFEGQRLLAKAEAAAAAERAAAEQRLENMIYHGAEPGPRPVEWSHIGFCIDSAQRSGAPFIDSAQRSGAQSIDSAPSLYSPQQGSALPADCRSVALGRSGGQVILSAGTIGMGKSVAELAAIEACISPFPGLSSPTLPPTAAIALHTDFSGTSLPELVFAAAPNQRAADLAFLKKNLNLTPYGLPQVRLLCHPSELDRRHGQLRAELGAYARDVEVRPLRLRLGQVGARGLEALLGVPPSRVPGYLNSALQRACDLGPDLRLSELRRLLRESKDLDARALRLLEARLTALDLLEDPAADLWDDVEPGVLTIYDLSGRWLRQRESFPLAVALLNAVADQSPRHGAFQRLVGLDEVNLLGNDPVLWEHLVMRARRARHSGLLLWLAGQDLLNVPSELLGLATQVLVFRLNNPEVFLDIRRRVAGLGRYSYEDVSALYPGQALWIAQNTREPALRGRPHLVYIRPTLCAHGGATRQVF